MPTGILALCWHHHARTMPVLGILNKTGSKTARKQTPKTRVAKTKTAKNKTSKTVSKKKILQSGQAYTEKSR